MVDLSNPRVGINIKEEGGKLLVDFMDTKLPPALDRKLDVTDFATPAKEVDTSPFGNGTRMVVTPSGTYEHLAYQTDNLFTLELKPLTKQQEDYYNTLKREMTFTADGERITAVNAAVNINKLLQISGGAVYSDDKEIIEFDVSNRIKVVMEVIEEASNKVLVFVPFTHTIDLLQEALKKRGISCGVINGKVPVNKRSTLVERFQKEPDPQVMLIQPQAASHGLTLTAADTIIWYAPVTSVETYLQANARINRPGQKHPMTVVHITGSPVERRLYSMLRGNIANHEKLIDLYRDMLSGDLSA